MLSQTPADIINNHTTLELECVDRMYLNVYQPILQTGGGISYFFKNARNKPIPSSALMGQMTRQFKADVEQYIADNNIEVIRFKKRERKDDITKENRVESALTEPTLSHHRTCDVAYGGFRLTFNKVLIQAE